MVGAALALTGCVRSASAERRTNPTSAPLAGSSAPAASSVPVTPRVEPSQEARALSDAFATSAQAIRPSVVRLDVEGNLGESSGSSSGQEQPEVPDFLRRFFDFGQGGAPRTPRQVKGTGSGVIIDGNGDILTNSHVVHGARKVTIQLPDQGSFPGVVVGTDPLTDVAVVRFEKKPPNLVAARIGDSDKLRIGEWVIAVGSPLGMDQTVTAGIISGVGETGSRFRFESGERVRKYIQTDAEINPGNSGGPLVSLQGEVLGLNTLINVGPGGSYGFAIPINQASNVAQTLIKEGHVRYPFIGVNVVGISDAPKELLDQVGTNLPKAGALVAEVTPGGPAASAGIKPGDVITKIGGHAVKTAADVVADISDSKIGGKVAIDYVRDGAAHSADVKIAEFPTGPKGEAGQAHLGVALQTLTPSIAESLGLDGRTKGAVITDVQPGSPADKAGLAAGDVIREIDKKPIASVEDAAAAIQTGKPTHLLRVTNASGTRFVTVTSE
jgi:serine protease Do